MDLGRIMLRYVERALLVIIIKVLGNLTESGLFYRLTGMYKYKSGNSLRREQNMYLHQASK